MHPLEQKRHNAFLSQRELTVRSGVDRTTIRNIEDGTTTNPHPKTIRALAEALGCAPIELMVPTAPDPAPLTA